jgi:peptidoglycan hydrolase-like protein with peptidoglycan-binding domain
MQRASLVIAMSVLAGLAACSNSEGNRGAPAHEALLTPPTIPTPPTPDMVRKVQMTLRDQGYYRTGPIDGVGGPVTEASLRTFQYEHELTASGRLDPRTLQALQTSPPAPGTPTKPDTNALLADEQH